MLIFVPTFYDNFERIHLKKNDFDLLTSSDLDLASRSFKVPLVDHWIMSDHSVQFHKD